MQPDGRVMRQWITAIVLFASSGAGSAAADSCVYMREASAASENGRFKLKAHYDRPADVWKATLMDAKTKKEVGGSLERLPSHAHFKAFVSNGGSRIVVFEPSAGHALADRVLIYDRNFRLLKSFGLDEMLTPDELNLVARSISHIHFTESDRQRKTNAWLERGVFNFCAKGGRTVRIDVAEPKILEPPTAQ
jgi:hypothetical protein